MDGNRTYVFGAFEFRPDTGELWKCGVRIRLQQKPLSILEALLEKQGEMVRREELFKRLWPSGTFVEYNSGLNTAVNRLRAALGDSADTPHYIETLPRLGYRFVYPARLLRDLIEESPAARLAEVPAAAFLPVSAPNLLPLLQRRAAKSAFLVLVLVIFAMLCGYGVALHFGPVYRWTMPTVGSFPAIRIKVSGGGLRAN